MDNRERELSILQNDLNIAKQALRQYKEGKSSFSSRKKIEGLIARIEERINKLKSEKPNNKKELKYTLDSSDKK